MMGDLWCANIAAFVLLVFMAEVLIRQVQKVRSMDVHIDVLVSRVRQLEKRLEIEDLVEHEARRIKVEKIIGRLPEQNGDPSCSSN